MGTPTRNCNLNFPVTHFPVVGPPFGFMTPWTLPGRLSTRCLNVSDRMAAHSSCRAVARAVNDVGCWGLEQSWHSNSSHRYSMGFRSVLWAGQSISGTLLSTNYSLTDLALWQGALSCWYTQSSSPKWSSTIDSMQRVKMSLYRVFKFPCSIMRGPSPFHEKHLHTVMPPPPNVTVGTTHASRYRSTGICHTQTHPSDRHVVFITPHHMLTVVHCTVALLFTPL
jgi:hypothetical protein